MVTSHPFVMSKLWFVCFCPLLSCANMHSLFWAISGIKLPQTFSGQFLEPSCLKLSIDNCVSYSYLPEYAFDSFGDLICRYEQAEFIERELEHMTEQIKSVIQAVNANQVGALFFCF